MAGLKVKKSVISPQCAAKRGEAKRGKRSCNWKGGRVIDKRTGYVHLWKPNHANANKTSRKSYSKGNLGYVLEHRFVMSEYLGRPLLNKEQVHHRNGNRSDNRIKNLELWTTSHPAGQSVAEKLKWAKEFINIYETPNLLEPK